MPEHWFAESIVRASVPHSLRVCTARFPIAGFKLSLAGHVLLNLREGPV
jgi:hypothetical protein